MSNLKDTDPVHKKTGSANRIGVITAGAIPFGVMASVKKLPPPPAEEEEGANIPIKDDKKPYLIIGWRIKYEALIDWYVNNREGASKDDIKGNFELVMDRINFKILPNGTRVEHFPIVDPKEWYLVITDEDKMNYRINEIEVNIIKNIDHYLIGLGREIAFEMGAVGEPLSIFSVKI